MVDFQKLPHEGIQTMKPYIPGKSVESVAREYGVPDIVKLASNENPWGCSPKVIETLNQTSSSHISRYPEINDLPEALSEKLHIPSDYITLVNGTDALFPLLLICFALNRQKKVLTHQYAFISYEIYAKSLGIPLVKTPVKSDFSIDLDAFIEAAQTQTALVFLANPNNPTGIPLSGDNIKRILKEIPSETILVLDEAYLEYFDNHGFNSLDLLGSHPNLVLTRTFSKAYGLAGLRLGYAIANRPISSILQRVRPPFCLSQAAIDAGVSALSDQAFIQWSVQKNKEELTQVCKFLAEMNIDYLPSAGNFVMINCKANAEEFSVKLLKKGIIVRPLHPYGLDDYIRVTIGTSKENTRFIAAFKEVYHGS